MIYQWYTGSDSSKEVPRRLARLDRGKAANSLDDTVAILRELLRIETDPNWRAYLLWRIGSELIGAARVEEGIAALLEAEAHFDPLLPTICDLVAEYCATLFTLIVVHYYKKGDFEKVAELAVTIVTELPNSTLNGSEKADVYFYQGFALEMLAKRHSLNWLHPVALASYLKWHRLDPEEPSCLEHLAYSYFNVGDMERSDIAARMCLEVEPEVENRGRVEKFLRDNARKLANKKR
jgi:tetratricopeptide (TPR) repeat protein